MSVKHLLDVRFGDPSELLGHHVAAFENQQCGDTTNLVATGRLDVRCRIDFADLHFTGILADDLIDDRGYLPARRAPLSPQANQNTPGRLQNLLLENSVFENQSLPVLHAITIWTLLGPL